MKRFRIIEATKPSGNQYWVVEHECKFLFISFWTRVHSTRDQSCTSLDEALSLEQTVIDNYVRRRDSKVSTHKFKVLHTSIFQ